MGVIFSINKIGTVYLVTLFITYQSQNDNLLLNKKQNKWSCLIFMLSYIEHGFK